MSVVIRLSSVQDRTGRVAFSRQELNRLLSLYSRRVMAGEWRDYAIDMRRDGAAFSIFRHTAEGPLYAIWKTAPRRGVPPEFEVYQGPRRLARSRSLDVALRTLERRLRVVA